VIASPAIDAFVFLGQSLFGYGQSVEELLARMDAQIRRRQAV